MQVQQKGERSIKFLKLQKEVDRSTKVEIGKVIEEDE